MDRKIYDITISIAINMPVYPGDPPVTIKNIVQGIKKNNPIISRISFGTHAGTHIDAPRHFFKKGKSLDNIPPEILIGPCVVCDADDADIIDANLIKSFDIKNEERVLFKTRNSNIWNRKNNKFVKDYVYLTRDAAEYLVSSGIKIISIDYFSVDNFRDKECPVHKILLSSGIVIIENLNLSAVPAGKYELICAPLKIKNADAAPARVFLVSS